MKSLLLAIAIIVLVILIFTVPIKIKAAVHINVLEDVGFGSIKLMYQKLFCAKFRITGEGRLEVDNAVKKKKKKKKNYIRKKYFACMLKLIDIKKFEIFVDSGSTYNAYVISMLCGYLSAMSSALIAMLINKYKHIKVFSSLKPSFDRDRLELSGSLVIAFSLLDMLLSIAYAYFSYLFMKIKENMKWKKKIKSMKL